MDILFGCSNEEWDTYCRQGAIQKEPYIDCFTWNSYPQLKKEYDHIVALKGIRVEWRKEPNGIHFPYVKGAVDLACVQEAKKGRINVLMNHCELDQKWIYPVLKKVIRKEDRVCILAFSFFDDTKNAHDWDIQYGSGQGIWFRSHTDCFKKYGIDAKHIRWVNYFTDTKEEMVDAIVNSSILLLPGGAPDLMMKRIKEKRLKSILKHYQGVIIGASAGAMVQLDDYHISVDEDYPEFSYQKGLGYVSGFDVEAHFRGSKQQMDGIRKVVDEKLVRVYGMSEDSAIVMDGEEINLVGKIETYEKGFD